jgi:multiple sugar transport system ATP-binding protein
MADVELKEVTKRFGTVEVCRGINLSISDGEFVTLLGPSGCGKTTTLHLVAGLEDPTSGEIHMSGRLVNALTPFERDVAMVFQNYALYPHMKVAENIGFTLKLRGVAAGEIRRRVAAIAEMLELTAVLDRLPAQLSGGQQQRVAIGRAMIRQPKVYLFDEPFSNLDAALRVKMRSEIKLLHLQLRVTSVFVTHDQEEALSISDRIAVMREGRIEQIGTPEEVYVRPLTQYVARFIGTPQIDFLAGDVVATADQAVFRIGEADFSLPPAAARRLATGTLLEVGVRPEHVLLSDRGISAAIEIVQPVGPSTFVTLVWKGGRLTARVPGMAGHRPGDKVRFTVEPRHLMFFDRASGWRIDMA